MKMLTVEVKGIGFPNKGAELMLAAIISQFEERNIKARFAVEPYGDYSLRSKFSLYQIARVKKNNVDVGKFLALLPKKLLNVFGIIKTTEIDLVLDASGFSYGDQWGAEIINDRLGTTIEYLKKSKRKVFLLPQALGPFEDEKVKMVSKKIFENCDKVFARDKVSLNHIRKIIDTNNVGICPDFTNLVSGLEYNKFDIKLHKVCFIPNSKMLEKTNKGSEYISMMSELLKKAYLNNNKPFLLVHEGEKDRNLALDIINRTGCDIPILEPVDPLKIKWVIGQSILVVSSRFHGLVSALSQGVPVIATGWSHKYKCLLADYGVEDCLFDVEKEQDLAYETMISLLEDKEVYREQVNMIKSNSNALKIQVNKMWDEVFEAINRM